MSKNLHIDHIEDCMFTRGADGFYDIKNILLDIQQVLETGKISGHDPVITTKWDGAPAIVCGINPENGKFFVGTKSVFSKVPKICYTFADIATNYPNHSDDFKHKMTCALTYLPELDIKTVLQGDIIFTYESLYNETINNQDYLMMKPTNIITYAIPKFSGIYNKAIHAVIGIVFHTEYVGTTLTDMTARYNPNIHNLNITRNVWYRNAVMYLNSPTGDLLELDNLFEKIEKIDIGARGDMILNHITTNKTIKDLTLMYINDSIRNQSTFNIWELITYIDGVYNLKIDSLVLHASKINKLQEKKKIVDFFYNNREKMIDILCVYDLIVEIKTTLINKLNLANQDQVIKSFIEEPDGSYKNVGPEGYVVIDPIGNVVKMVDRRVFSYTNFMKGIGN